MLAAGRGLKPDPVEAAKWHVLASKGGRSDSWLDDFVNLVIPDFGDGYLNDDHEFDFRRVGRTFFEHFEDTYDSLAVLPQLTYLPSYGAFHRNVKNTVRGLGMSLFDLMAACLKHRT